MKNSTAENSTLVGASLIKAVAKQTGYHLYEVEDVLNGLSIVMTKALQDNTAVKLKDIGTLYPYRMPDKNLFNMKTKEMVWTRSKNNVKFLITKTLKNNVNIPI